MEDVERVITPFAERVDEANASTEERLGVLQVNVGRRCNLACRHCHVEAGPDRTELMARETMEACLKVFSERGFDSLDITGGAPEMNPDFEWFIMAASATGKTVMVRSNLVILHEPEYAHLPERYRELGITVVASLPHYTKKSVEKMRGDDTFDKIIAMLQRLNELGYGKEDGPELDLVFNPAGAIMPPAQASLEAEYRRRLGSQYGIVFNNLFAITNNPLGRFGEFLKGRGIYDDYLRKLEGAFNSATLPGMMCRNQISVGWDGRAYDCDFNQAADIPCLDGRTIFDYLDPAVPLKRAIAFGDHCYACCAGSGSSCGGTTA